MQIHSPLTEKAIIAKIKQSVYEMAPSEGMGIGDDCSVVFRKDGIAELVTTDILLEGVHFLRNKITPEQLARKAIGVNMSDVAAMGGVSRYIWLSIALPMDVESSWWADFSDDFSKTCKQHNVVLLGGDTTGSHAGIFINITAMGEAKINCVKYRKGAKVGDVVAVTQCLGDSRGGLYLLNEKAIEPEMEYLIRSHLEPKIEVEAGPWFSAQEEVHAMMDVSDGLVADVRRLAEASGVGIDINLKNLPKSKEFKTVSKMKDWDTEKMAALGGEDYCLLVSIDREVFEKIANKFHEKFKRPLYPIGDVTNGSGGVVFQQGSIEVIFDEEGFDHFQLKNRRL